MSFSPTYNHITNLKKLIVVHSGPERIELISMADAIYKHLDGMYAYGFLSEATEEIHKTAIHIRRETPTLRKNCNINWLCEKIATWILKKYATTPENTITANTPKELISDLIEDLERITHSKTHFIPCNILEGISDDFHIGPVTFVHKTSKTLKNNKNIKSESFKKFLKHLKKNNTHWVAIVPTQPTEAAHSITLANTAVDLAISSLQLCIHHLNCQHMGRTMRGLRPTTSNQLFTTGEEETPSYFDGHPFYSYRLYSHDLVETLESNREILEPAGYLIKKFLEGSEDRVVQGCIDSLYWYHEAICENIDTIAIAKHEISAEILYPEGNPRGSQRRITEAIFSQLNLNQAQKDEYASELNNHIKKIITARSKILHGTASTLANDLELSRETAAQLSRFLLRSNLEKIFKSLHEPHRTPVTTN